MDVRAHVSVTMVQGDSDFTRCHRHMTCHSDSNVVAVASGLKIRTFELESLSHDSHSNPGHKLWGEYGQIAHPRSKDKN